MEHGNHRPSLRHLLALSQIASLLIVCLLALPVHSAFALADPDTIRMESITRYDDVAVTGDMFIMVEYTLEYAVLPDESIAQGWVGRLIDVGGAGQLSAITPYNGSGIPDQGYSQGAFGFYFATEPTITGTLRVSLEGNLALSPTPIGTFSESIIQQTALDLAPDLRAQALRLEDVWALDLISPIFGGINRYTVDGENYFSSALPNLKNLAPDLFSLQNVTLAVPDRSFDTTYTDARFAVWDGTLFKTGFTSLAAFMNTSETVARFAIALVLAIAVAVGVGLASGIRGTEYQVTTQIWAAYLVMFGGFFVGLVTIQVLGAMLVPPIIVMAIQWNLNRSGA